MYPHGAYFGITPSYYGFVGIAPVGITPHVPPVAPIVQTPVTATPVVTSISEVSPAQYVREKPPVTTVFVGNISDRAPDQLIKTLLMRCGNILSWKRVQGASGKLQAFGFCEYEDPESTMRCVRLLNGFSVGDKKLLVKVDAKTEDLLNEYRKKKEQTGEEKTLAATSEEVDSSTRRDDDDVKAALEGILRESSSFLDGSGSPRRADVYHEGPRHLTMEDMDLDEDKKDLINREIEIFRKRNEKEDQSDTAPRRPKPRETVRSTAGLQLYSVYVEDDRKEREYRRDKFRDRSRSRSADNKRSKGKLQAVDEEEEAIRKKLERKLREKEEAYQKRLKQWESRERKKANEYEHEREHERKRQKDLQIEAQRLREFFEDYNDTIEDPKYYRGSALHQRLKDRELEEAADERDRQKEVEQIEAARRKLFEEKDPNAESIIFQMEQKMQEHLRKRFRLNDYESVGSEVDNEENAGDMAMGQNHTPQPVSCDENKQEELNDHTPVDEPVGRLSQPQSQFQPTEFCATPADEASVSLSKDGSSTFLFAMSTAEPVVRKKAAVFTDEESEEKPKRHAPSWLPPSALSVSVDTTKLSQANGNVDSMSTAAMVANFTPEERNALIKRIIDGIPTSRREVFSYPIEWDMVDKNFVNTRIKPWVDRKIIGYIGESEATLSNFICDQLVHRNPPERILSDIAMVLDEEAEVFVVKMWRLLIYLIAEKKAGLST